jgi:hypothetical protein
LGVNIIYGCFRFHHDPETLLRSLTDNLRGRVKIDMIRLQGPDFQNVDNRLLCLWLVKNGLSDVAIFGPDTNSLHAGEFLYKKSILIARGSYRPPTLVQQDMIRCALEQFQAEPDIDRENTFFLTEITLDNLCADGTLDVRDFLDRADILCALGQTVIISNCLQHQKLIAYFADYKIRHIGLAMGARKLQNILRETCEANPDNLLGAFGELFPRNVRFYVHPALSPEHAETPGDTASRLITVKQLPAPPAIHFLYDHLLENRNIVDIQHFNPNILDIYHKEVLKQIRDGTPGWEEKVPAPVAQLIRERGLFGYAGSAADQTPLPKAE